MKIGIYVNIKKKHLVDILNIILAEFIDPQYKLIFLNKQKHINKLIDISDYLKNRDDSYDILLTIGGHAFNRQFSFFHFLQWFLIQPMYVVLVSLGAILNINPTWRGRNQ